MYIKILRESNPWWNSDDWESRDKNLMEYRKFSEIYYYRNSYEIDCIAGDLKIEVKAGKPHRKYPGNVTVLDEESVPEFLIEAC